MARIRTIKSNLHMHYQNMKGSIIHAFDRAKSEHWDSDRLLRHRNEWIFNDFHKRLPRWVKYKLEGVWDACHDLFWRELLVCYPHPDSGVLTTYEDLEKANVDMSRLDTDACRMCFQTEDKALHPYT